MTLGTEKNRSFAHFIIRSATRQTSVVVSDKWGSGGLTHDTWHSHPLVYTQSSVTQNVHLSLSAPDVRRYMVYTQSIVTQNIHLSHTTTTTTTTFSPLLTRPTGFNQASSSCWLVSLSLSLSLSLSVLSSSSLSLSLSLFVSNGRLRCCQTLFGEHSSHQLGLSCTRYIFLVLLNRLRQSERLS